MSKAKFKVGQKVDGRIIYVIDRRRNAHGNKAIMIGYKYEHQSRKEPVMWCDQKTLIRHHINKA